MKSCTVVFDGSSLSTLSENRLADIRRTKISFVFQQPTLLRNLNILDNIILPSMRDRKMDRDGLSEKARKLMEKADISGLEDRQTTQASGGQLQRVGICRALMHDPKVIFGDEPTGALNSKSASDIMRLFAGIHQNGTTIVLVTHDAKIAARTERVLFMIDGRITGENLLGSYHGDPEELKDREEKLNSWLTEKEFSDMKTWTAP